MPPPVCFQPVSSGAMYVKSTDILPVPTFTRPMPLVAKSTRAS